MSGDFLALDPLENDDDLIDNLIKFSEENQLNLQFERNEMIKDRVDLSKDRLHEFIQDTNKSVFNVSCQVNDYPQQYRLNQHYQQNQQQSLNQQNQLQSESNEQQELQLCSLNPDGQSQNSQSLSQSMSNVQYQVYQLNNQGSQQPIYSDNGHKVSLNPVYTQPYYLDQNSVVIYPQANNNPCFQIISTQSDRDCQLMEPPIIPRKNPMQNSIDNSQSVSNENVSIANNSSNRVRRPLGEIQNQSRFNSADDFDEQQSIDPNESEKVCSKQAKKTVKRAKSTKSSSKNKRKKKSGKNDDSQLQPIDIPEEFRILPENIAMYFKEIDNVNTAEATSSQQELEQAVINDDDFVKMFNYSKMVCSSTRYSSQRYKYLNQMETLTYNEADLRMDSKEMSDQFKRIQAKNQTVKKAKFKNRATMNVNLVDLYYEASKLSNEKRIKSLKELVLKLELKMKSLSKKMNLV